MGCSVVVARLVDGVANVAILLVRGVGYPSPGGIVSAM